MLTAGTALGLETNILKLSAPCFQGMRQPLRCRLPHPHFSHYSLSCSSYILKTILSSITFFSKIFFDSSVCPSQSRSKLPSPSFSSFLFRAALNQQLRCYSIASATLIYILSPSLGWTADGVGGGAAMLGNLGHLNDNIFWIYELLPTRWNFPTQIQLEMVELSFFHEVLHTRCETFAMTSQIFLSYGPQLRNHHNLGLIFS